MATRDVDALWQDLAMENEYRNVDISRLLKKSMAMGGNAKKAKASVGRRATCAATHPNSASHRDNSKNLKDEESFSLPKVLNRLAAEQRSVRKKAALALETQFLNDGTEQQATETTATDAFAEMAKPLFKRFNDPVEKVREVCIRLSTKCFAVEEDLLRYLPYLMPAITNRINSQYGYDEENQVFSRDQFLHDAFKRGRVYVADNQVTRIKPDEPSEEIRLLLLGLVDAVLQNAFERRASSILHAYIFDVLLVLISGIHDDFHEINIASCRILATISNHMVSVMKHFTVATVRTLMLLLLHRLARVRVAVVETIRALVTCPNVEKCKGSGTEAIVDLIGHRDENVIPVASFYTAEVRLNYFAKLDQDRNPMVRRAFFAMISDWMLNLPDRYDHESRLLPYLLSAVSDEDLNISGDALKTLEILGGRYEREHGEEVIEIKQYGVDGKNPTYNYRAPLPEPFVAGRPSLGTRLFVRGRARRFLNPILRELANWQDSTRAHAVRLLKCVLVYCEEAITVDVHSLVHTLLRTWGGDHDLLPELRQCAELAGRFAAPTTYLPLLLSRIRGDSDVVVPTVGGAVSHASQIEVALQVLHCLLRGSLDKMVLPHVPEILDTIALPSILDIESSAVKMALGQVLLHITKLLERSGSDAVTAFFLERGRLTSMEQSYSRIFDIAVVVMASSYCSAAVAEASDVLKHLAALESLMSIDQLYDKYSSSLLLRAIQSLQDILAVQWSPHSSAQLALEQILMSAPVDLLVKQGADLNNIFQAVLLPTPPSTGSSSVQIGSPSTTIAREGNAKKSRGAREQKYEQVLKRLMERVQAVLQRQGDLSASSVEASYVEQWVDFLSATEATAA
ncbi:hypothetical protein GN958_ATG05108 [Phytophthora infestans]|uniref:Uncharacterized protein n=1 Tax=Phytophthora infestans TaxID=4787 RepID=A0A8S9UXA7_PHYIN|nr:hypothetical protein GN958_ATG05108 [Phytophthora infestans]